MASGGGSCSGTVVRLWKCTAERPADWAEKMNSIPHKEWIAPRSAVQEAFCTVDGVRGSDERHFYTSTTGMRLNDADKARDCSAKLGCSPERALLAQSSEHYATLEKRYQLPSGCFLGEPAVFGENMCIQGLHADNICVGDTFTVVHEGQATLTRLQVSSPRLPCGKVTTRCKPWVRQETHKGQEQVKSFCSRTGLAGWFFRVLDEGPISIGDKLERTEQLLPDWSLNRLADAMRRHTYRPSRDGHNIIKHWIGTEQELETLASCEALADFEWREAIQKHLRVYRSKGAATIEADWKKEKTYAKAEAMERHMASVCSCHSGSQRQGSMLNFFGRPSKRPKL